MNCTSKIRFSTLRGSAEHALNDHLNDRPTRPYQCTGRDGCGSFHVTSDLRGVTVDDVRAVVRATGGRC